MSSQILMPALSPTMEEGKLAKWLVKEGDEVHSGDILAEIETDKATMEFEAVDEGKIGKLLVPEGTEGVKVNEPIATLAGRWRGRERGGRSRLRRSAVRDEAKQAPKTKPSQRQSSNLRQNRLRPHRSRRKPRRWPNRTCPKAPSSSP